MINQYQLYRVVSSLGRVLVYIILNLIIGTISYGAELNSSEVSTFFESGLSKQLDSYLKRDTFYLNAKVLLNRMPKSTKKEVPYLLEGDLNSELGEIIAQNQLKKYVRGIIINLTMDERYSEKTVSFVQTVVKDFMAANGGIRYKVNLKRFKLDQVDQKGQEKAEAAKMELDKLQSESRLLSKRLDEKEQQVSQSNQTVESLKLELDRAKSENNEQRSKLMAESLKLDNMQRSFDLKKNEMEQQLETMRLEVEQLKNAKPIWETNLGQIILATGIGLAILIFSTIVLKGTKIVSAVIERVGKMIAGSAKGSAAAADDLGSNLAKEAPTDELRGKGGTFDQFSQLLKLKEDLATSIDASQQFLLVKYICLTLKSENEAEKVLCLLEMLSEQSRETINELLPAHIKSMIAQFASGRKIVADKSALSFEVFQEIKTYLTAESFANIDKQLNDRMLLLIITTDSRVLLNFTNGLDSRELDRLVQYLDPSIIKSLLSTFSGDESDAKARFLTAIANTAKESSLVELDGGIYNKLMEHCNQVGSDSWSSTVTYYLGLLKVLDNDSRELLLEKIAASNEEISGVLSRRFPVFDSFFKISSAHRKIIAEGLDVKSIAVLIAHTKQGDHKNMLIKVVDPDILDLVEEEYLSLQSQDLQQTITQYQRLKSQLTSRIKPHMLDYQSAANRDQVQLDSAS